MERLLRSEADLRDGLEDTLSRQNPATPGTAIKARVEQFLLRNDWDDNLPEVWKRRWRNDREAERAGR